MYGREQINQRRGNIRDWICDTDDEVMVDAVGRFERLAEDWGAIADQLGIDAPFPHLNRGNRGDYRALYDDASCESVERRFAWVIDRFEYRF